MVRRNGITPCVQFCTVLLQAALFVRVQRVRALGLPGLCRAAGQHWR